MRKQNKKPPTRNRPYTIVRLAYGATLEQACELAGLNVSEVDLTQSVAEKPIVDPNNDFRIISFDGLQMTISERVRGERRTRGFEVPAKSIKPSPQEL